VRQLSHTDCGNTAGRIGRIDNHGRTVLSDEANPRFQKSAVGFAQSPCAPDCVANLDLHPPAAPAPITCARMMFMHLLQALRNEAAKLTADLENSNLFAQMGDRGSHREMIIKNFLRPFLPECYGLSSGEVFSADGAQSAQIDVVVYDAVFSAVLFRNQNHSLFPAESVFGAVEVKSELNSAELERACQNSSRLKSLQRPATDVLDFTPLVRFNVGSMFTTGETLPRNPYMTFAFGFSGPSPEATANNLNQRLASEPASKLLLPDFVFVSNPGYMIARISGALETSFKFTLPGQDFTKYVFLNVGADALPLFFLTLNVCLGQVRLRAVDYVTLWTTVVNQIRRGQ
jgi:hypothetical protein